MLRRLHHEQPESFAFTPENQAWAEAQMTKYPEGRQASAVIALLWRAQEQHGWLTRTAIEYVAAMLGMAYIRVLEVATFYFMFQLAPVGTVAHVQVCGTTSCMLCGSEDLMEVCKGKIAANPHELSSDGKFSWEEVECLGACSNAPMAQIGKDYYEDLTPEILERLIDEMAEGKVPVPGPQNGRYSSEPKGGLTALVTWEKDRMAQNASVDLAGQKGDTLKRIDGTEQELRALWQGAETALGQRREIATGTPLKIEAAEEAAPAVEGTRPAALESARDGGPDDLKKIKGVGPKLEEMLNAMGFYNFDQIAHWTEAEVAWVDDNLEGFKGRVSRDGWVEQAKLLAAGEEA